MILASGGLAILLHEGLGEEDVCARPPLKPRTMAITCPMSSAPTEEISHHGIRGSVSVISRQVMDDQQAIPLADALRNFPASLSSVADTRRPTAMLESRARPAARSVTVADSAFHQNRIVYRSRRGGGGRPRSSTRHGDHHARHRRQFLDSSALDFPAGCSCLAVNALPFFVGALPGLRAIKVVGRHWRVTSALSQRCERSLPDRAPSLSRNLPPKRAAIALSLPRRPRRRVTHATLGLAQSARHPSLARGFCIHRRGRGRRNRGAH